MAVKRSFSSKPRGKVTKQRKPVLLLICEGKNKTEKAYFRHFNTTASKYSIHPFCTGDTDPKGMLDALERRYNDNDLSPAYGDLAFVVLDLDGNAAKAATIQTLTANPRNKNFGFIVSNPSFEVWYLNHFRFSTKQYQSQSAVIADLRQYIPNYEKNLDVFDSVYSLTANAVSNEASLDAHHAGTPWPSPQRNPHSDVPKLIPYLTAQKP